MARPMKVSERVIGDSALLSHQWSIGCECNMPLDKSQWWRQEDDGVIRCKKKVTKMMSWKIRTENGNRARNSRKSPEDGRAKSITRCRKKVTKMMSRGIWKVNRYRARKSRKSPEDRNPDSDATAKESEKNLDGRPGKQLLWMQLTRVQAHEHVESETSETLISDKKRLWKRAKRKLMGKEDDI